jgi:hypothetical protein
MTLPQPPYTYATEAEANAASNQLFLAVNPDGTAELLWGWFINDQGQYQLPVPDGWEPPTQ